MALLEVTEYEEKVVEPYLRLNVNTLEEKMARTQEQMQVLLETNTNLQEKLEEQGMICKEMQDRFTEFQVLVFQLEAERDELKGFESEVREQLKQIGQGRLAEEIRLRKNLLQLEEKLCHLTTERTRLQNQGREETEMIARYARQIESMEGQVISLEEKKAWLENAEHS